MTCGRLRWSAVILFGLVGCKCPGPKVQPSVVPSCVPKVLVAHQGTPTVDGQMDAPVWLSAAATAPFIHEKLNRVVPHTEARAAWDPEALYLVLYVADADLRSSDQVTVAFEGGGAIEVSPSGWVQCRFGGQNDCTGVVAKLDLDGDADADKEEDEEWAVELKVPWKRLGPTGRPNQLSVNFSRLETLNGERLREVWSRTCGAIRLE